MPAAAVGARQGCPGCCFRHGPSHCYELAVLGDSDSGRQTAECVVLCTFQVDSGRSAGRQVESSTSESRVAAGASVRGFNFTVVPVPRAFATKRARQVWCASSAAYRLAYVQSRPVPMDDATPPAYYK